MKWYLVGALCVLAALLALEGRFQSSFLGRSEKPEHAAASPNDNPPDVWVQDVFVVEQTTAGKSKSWALFAKEIAFYDDQAAGARETIAGRILPTRR